MAVSWEIEPPTETERQLMMQERTQLEKRHTELCTEGQRLADSDDAGALRAHITQLHEVVLKMLACWKR